MMDYQLSFIDKSLQPHHLACCDFHLHCGIHPHGDPYLYLAFTKDAFISKELKGSRVKSFLTPSNNTQKNYNQTH